MEMLSLGAKGTIRDIAIKLRDIFRDFKGVPTIGNSSHCLNQDCK